MTSIAADPKLVAYCGLYCGACGQYLRGRCQGCAKNEKAKWCRLRTCCMENTYASCASCTSFPDVADCGKFNTFMAKIFAFIFRSNRRACIDRIRAIGVEQYAAEMAEKKMQSIKR